LSRKGDFHEQPDIRSISRIKLPNVNQIGHSCEGHPGSVAIYKTPQHRHWYRSNTVKHEAIYRGNPIDPEVDIVLAFQGGVEIEIIQVKGKKENVYSDMLGKCAAASIISGSP